jgi:pleckstrin homology domain-containing family A member 1/2
VLRPTHLACYKTSAEYKLLRLLDIADIHAATPVQLKRHPNTCGIVTRARTFYFQAETAADIDEWVQKLNVAKEALLQNTGKGGASSEKGNNNVVVPATPVVIPPSTTTSPTTAVTSATTTTAIAATTVPVAIPSVSTSPVKSPPSISILVPSTSPSGGGGPNDPSSPLSAVRPGGGGGNTSSDSDEPTQQAGGGRASTSKSPANVLSSSSKEKEKDPGKQIMSGYLMKCGTRRKTWRKRFFVLTTTRIAYMGNHMVGQFDLVLYSELT